MKYIMSLDRFSVGGRKLRKSESHSIVEIVMCQADRKVSSSNMADFLSQGLSSITN